MLNNLSIWVILPAAILLLILVYIFVIRPAVILRWGATSEEATRPLPGDDVVPHPMTGYTYAITIHAPPEKVWPWLVQMGYQRAGFYSHDFVYKLIGAYDFVDGNSARRIIPELQELKVGDQIKIHSVAPFTVDELEPNRSLVLRVRANFGIGKDFTAGEALPAQFMRITWVYALEPVDSQTTRLIVRWRSDYTPSLGMWIGFGGFLEPGSFVMQTQMLRGIKHRAENGNQ